MKKGLKTTTREHKIDYERQDAYLSLLAKITAARAPVPPKPADTLTYNESLAQRKGIHYFHSVYIQTHKQKLEEEN